MKKKAISMIVMLMMIVHLFSAFAQASVPNQQSSNDNDVLREWNKKGWISGYPDGQLHPERSLTRAQFAKVIQTLFGFSTDEVKPFQDVQKNQWYYDAVTALAGEGVMKGYTDHSFRPNAEITREEAAVLINRVFQLDKLEINKKDLTVFDDVNNIAPYAYSSLQLLISLGLMQDDQGLLLPKQPITRLEAISLLSSLVGEVISKSGNYEANQVSGHLIIQQSDVTVENSTIKKNVYLTSGLASGQFHAKGVKIDGMLFVNGGGQHSIYLHDANVDTIYVAKQTGEMVRIVITGSSKIKHLIVQSDAIIEIGEGVEIEQLTFDAAASGSQLHNNGVIRAIQNNANIKIPAETNPSATHSPQSTPSPTVAPTTTPITTPTATPTTTPITTPITTPTTTPTTTPLPTSSPSPTSSVEPTPSVDEWRLVWSDEFDGTGENLDTNGLDLDKWGYQNGTGAQYGLVGWGNNEAQYYQPDNLIVEDGLLKITAKKESYEDKQYTSGRIYTEHTFNKTYGKFEARMKLPLGAGMWPAFWMMPAESAYGTWAASGEIDIMEARGRVPDSIGGAIHFGKKAPNNKFLAKDYQFPAGETINDYHVYGLEWEPGELRWYVDGVLYQKINNWDSWGEGQPAKYAFPAPFDQPYYMILNLAVGGSFDGGILPSDSIMPSQMLVDYVRVYELDSRPYREVTEPTVEQEPISLPYKEAINGNYVYDSSFTEGFTNVAQSSDLFNDQFWNFVHLPSFNGAGAIEVDQINDQSFAKINISAAGTETHAIQLIQHVTVGKGRWYKLSFDAKSNTNRNMYVKIGGGEDRGWSVYSDHYEAKLSNDLQHYDMYFQMNAETDKQARLEFNVGSQLSPVWIGNVKLEEVDSIDPYDEQANKEPLRDGNHVYNGSFDLGYVHRMTYWNFIDNTSLALASVEPNDRKLRVDIPASALNPEDVALVQKGISLIDGNTYELTFEANANLPKDIYVDLLSTDGTSYGLLQPIAVTTSSNLHTVTFDLQGAVERNGQLVFYLGGSEATVFVDNIVLIRTTNNNVEGLTLEQQFPLKNGDFADGSNHWATHVQGKYDGWDQTTNMSVQNEQAIFNVWSIGNNPWDVMLMQEMIELKKDTTYVISFDMNSEIARDIELVIENASYQRFLSETVHVKPEVQTYSYEFTMSSDELVTLKYLLGKLNQQMSLGSHIITLDHVKLEEKGAREKAFLAKNGSFDYGLTGWNSHIQGVYDGPSSASFNGDEEVLHATIQHPGINPWDIVFFQDLQSLIKGKTYIVSFVAKASDARKIDVVVENGSYTRFLNETITLSDQVTTYSFEFTMDYNDLASLKFLFGQHAGDATSNYEVFIDNVRFELRGALEATGESARIDHQIP